MWNTIRTRHRCASDYIVAARANFEIRGQRLNWKLLFVPDAPSMELLRELMDNAD